MAESTKSARPVRSEELVREVKERLAGQLISSIYRDRIRPMRTRSFQLFAVARKTRIEIFHTLLGIELKIGKRRLLCPDLATARYLSVFARLGVEAVAIPYDITQVSRLADELESAWFQMLVLVDHLTAGGSARLRSRVQSRLVSEERAEVTSLGAGPAVPQFNQNTKQRKGKP